MGYTISIINHNDKSGKTIISFNLAAALALSGRKTLYLTTHENSDLSSLLISKNKKFEFDIFYGSELSLSFPYDSIHSLLLNLDFLTIDFNFESKGEVEKDQLTLSIKSELESKYDYIIIDSPSGLTDGMDIAVSMSDEYIIPLEISNESFDSLTPLFARMEWLKKEKKANADFSGFILNKTDENKRLKDIFLNSSFYFFGSRVMEPVIPFDRLFDNERSKTWSILDDIISLPGRSFLNLARFIDKNKEV